MAMKTKVIVNELENLTVLENNNNKTSYTY